MENNTQIPPELIKQWEQDAEAKYQYSSVAPKTDAQIQALRTTYLQGRKDQCLLTLPAALQDKMEVLKNMLAQFYWDWGHMKGQNTIQGAQEWLGLPVAAPFIAQLLPPYPTVPTWVKADEKPPHNKGVLVFIPQEDNHITAGMWDISNKWVLLDEYRTPECPVTHWMEMPPNPTGYEPWEMPEDFAQALKEVAANDPDYQAFKKKLELPPDETPVTESTHMAELEKQLAKKDEEIKRLTSRIIQLEHCPKH